MSLLKNIIGNEKLLTKLAERAQAGKLASLMIFAGPSGVGKKLSALALSQELICPKGPPACGVCGACLRIQNLKSESVLLIEPEGASSQIKLEQSREIERFVQLRQIGKARTIIVDQAHRLNPQSSNALLKLFEEPPANTYIFLITQSPNSLLATIRSRAQLFRFSTLTDDQIKTLTGADAWMLNRARGQLDLLQKLKDNSKAWTDAQKQAHGFISRALNGELDLFSQMKEIAGDRETSLQNILVWQSLFRDALAKQLSPSSLAVNDGAQALVDKLSQIDSDILSGLSLYLVEMEQDLSANLDRTLLLENFFFKMTSLTSAQTIGHDPR